jgi:hypothetical protein
MLMFAITYGKLHNVYCDWCEEPASAEIYTRLPVQHACDEHLAGWLIGQSEAVAGNDTVREIVGE